MKEKSKLNKKGILLYLDTSEPEAILSIYENEELKSEIKWLAHRELSATLSTQFQRLLQNNNLKIENIAAIIVFSGPGSFTGLRIGLSFANALAYSLKIPIFETSQKNKFFLDKPLKIVIPKYGSDPKITKPKLIK